MNRTFRNVRSLILAGVAGAFFAVTAHAQAVVQYDKGRMQIKGVTLLQSYGDSTAYYYVPQYPRLATGADGAPEILMLEYTGRDNQAKGGLFHALVTFDLPQALRDSIEKLLQATNARRHIVGPVPMTQAVKDGDDGLGSFQIVSATLSDTGANRFTRSVVTSGRAPFAPGSKAVVAALLNEQGATLLWNSLTAGSTSDVSIAIHGSYEAAIDGYNATVTAAESTVYNHFSLIAARQKDYTKKQIRDIVDSLRQDGTLKVEVSDRSAGLDINTKDMDAILNLVTEKLTTLMFDHTNGWATTPTPEVAVEADQLKGRQEEGFFAKVFGGGDTKYYTDDQWVLKKRQDVKIQTFRLYLAKGSTVKVPVDAAGNLGGLYANLPNRDRYFRVVNLDDPNFQQLTVRFYLDADVVDAFQDIANFVTVNIRKTYPDRPAMTKSITIDRDSLKKGITSGSFVLSRTGDSTANWHNFEYRIVWSLKGGNVSIPSIPDRWLSTDQAAIVLAGPFQRDVVQLELDRTNLAASGMVTSEVQFASMLAGKTQRVGDVLLRAADVDPTKKVAVYRDQNQPVVYNVQWSGPGKPKVTIKPQALDGIYILLSPPLPPGPPPPAPTPPPPPPPAPAPAPAPAPPSPPAP